ncbi:hypothetical protein RG963_08925 [Methanosarcina sp. Z-7115]|uniref:Arylsulfatase n=1 Tax=Methanosarcina baikalica TaxID=3073890 RepID=A0ABU2D1R9_9EURY|nr:hypothetical protein [Methanosarcina sp. Z-7115]MDR7665891.1 hypothetical protein [Methanosarcina sp. Z-7115]
MVYYDYFANLPKNPEGGYTLNEDLTDRAIQLVADAKQVTPNKPFFMYLCRSHACSPSCSKRMGR